MTSSTWRTTALALFALGCAAVVVFLFTGTGMQLPFTEARDYRVSFATDDAGNLVTASDVQVAGVSVGKVERIENRGARGAWVELALTPEVVPLHEGVQVRVGERSLVGEGIVQLIDGKGRTLPSGAKLPPQAVRPSVQLHDVLSSLDGDTRAALSSLSRSLGDGTRGSREDLSRLMSGLGNLGREGHTAVDAIASQSEDLTVLAREATEVLRALNVSDGQIGDLVDSAERVTAATAGQADSLRSSVRKLPDVLESATTTSIKLRGLTSALGPVATDLKEAAPHLTKALSMLPGTAKDLRDLLPSLDTALARAPGTLKRVPAFAQDVREMVPTLRTTMSHVNPIVGYLEPYGRDLAGFFTNFGAILDFTDEAGISYLRMGPAGYDQVLVGNPVRLPDMLSWRNPYPFPGNSENHGPEGRGFDKIYPQPK